MAGDDRKKERKKERRDTLIEEAERVKILCE